MAQTEAEKDGRAELGVSAEEAREVANLLRYAVGLNTAAGLVSPTGRRLATPTYRAVELAARILEGESFEEAAVREVEEETGLRCRIVSELDCTRYRDGQGRPKTVRYWLMEVTADGPFAPSGEVDELRWLEPRDAEGVLTYPHDRALVAALV